MVVVYGLGCIFGVMVVVVVIWVYCLEVVVFCWGDIGMIVGFIEYCGVDGYIFGVSDCLWLVMGSSDGGFVFWWSCYFWFGRMEYELDGCIDVGIEFFGGLVGMFDMEVLIVLLFVGKLVFGVDFLIDEGGDCFECEILWEIGYG